MYEWWRFQRYRTCLKKLDIRIGIEKFNFFIDKLKIQKQKTVGSAFSIVVCVCGMFGARTM